MAIRISLWFWAFFLFSSCVKPSTRFTLLSANETGLHFSNEIIEKNSFNIIQNMYMYNGGGVGIADLNNDGLPDIVFTGNKVTSKIFLNLGCLKFKDITTNFKGLNASQWISGVSVTDINADGLLDLYFTSTQSQKREKRRNQLWVNQGIKNQEPYFIEMAEDYGIADDNNSVHSAFVDYDLDGDLDLYVLNNIVDSRVPSNYRPKIIDGSAVNNDKLYKNVGGRFIDVTKEAGILIEGYGLGLAVGDINKDGYPDFYISNDFISNDILYINQKDGTFRNEAKNLLSYQSMFSMGNDIADINNDGNPEIITVDMMPEKYARKKTTISSMPYLTYINNEKFGYEPQYVRNMLHLNNGFSNGQLIPYSEIGQLVGIYQTEWSWSPLFADYDNDGDKDLLITNGFPKDLTDKDFINYKASDQEGNQSHQKRLARMPIVKVANYAFENVDGIHFRIKTNEWGMNIPSFSNGAAYADLDNDGDLDYVVNNINDNAFVYRNNSIELKSDSSNYLKIVLKGSKSNTMAIGAKVELWCQGNYQYKEKFLSRGYISSVDPTIHFGVGTKSLIDSIMVTWPNNHSVTRVKNLQSNQNLVLLEDEAEPYHVNKDLKAGHYLFELAGDFGYQHQQSDYVDFFKSQRILQHKLSMIGPVMAIGDIDRDGLSELIIGASDKQPTLVYRRQGKNFEPTNVIGLTISKDCQEADIAILDLDNDGDNDVITVSGGYDHEYNSDYIHYWYRNLGSKFERSQIPIPGFPASIVRPFDYDKDGDLDLFIGARVVKQKFPYSAKSYLIINDKGTLSSANCVSFDLGMVTDAIWNDIDSDGWVDLLIAREWGSITVLQNNQGEQLIEEKKYGISQRNGLWTSLAVGDFDADGDDDFIVGNLGDNHRFTVTDKYPLKLYGIDLDKNGSIDPVATSYWMDSSGVMKEYPINYLEELNTQSPVFKKMFTSYAKFGRTPAREMLGSDTISQKHKFEVSTTSHFVVWREKESFVWQKLPVSIQFAPIHKMLVKDLNGDGFIDILFAGNDHSYDVSTGLYDASRGYILLGNGSKNLTEIKPSESGLSLRGQVESLIYLDGPQPMLLAGVNRQKALLFKISK